MVGSFLPRGCGSVRLRRTGIVPWADRDLAAQVAAVLRTSGTRRRCVEPIALSPAASTIRAHREALEYALDSADTGKTADVIQAIFGKD
jgi:hypothetical protein